MQWLLDNWILVLFGGGMIAMHLFGHGKHGKHGGHGGCCGGGKDDKDDSQTARISGAQNPVDRKPRPEPPAQSR